MHNKKLNFSLLILISWQVSIFAGSKIDNVDCLELNPANDFTNWENIYIKELHSLEFQESLGNMLLFEDDSIRLWNLKLNARERMPFLMHNKNYSWISEKNALLKSRFGNGRISLIRVYKGETQYFQNFGKGYINDLENLGETPAVFKVLEYKHKFHDISPIFN